MYTRIATYATKVLAWYPMKAFEQTGLRTSHAFRRISINLCERLTTGSYKTANCLADL